MTRLLLFVLGVCGAVLVTAPRAAAHVAGEGALAFEIEVLGTGAMMLVGVAVLPFLGRLPRRTFLVTGVFLVAMSFVVPAVAQRPSAGDVTLRITAPADGDVVGAGEKVRIEAVVRGAPLAPDASSTDGGHLHVFVDGLLQEMVYRTGTEVALAEGEHEIIVEYTDARHLSFDPRVMDTVTVEARDEPPQRQDAQKP